MEARTTALPEELTRRVTYRDETLPHQIVLTRKGVSCNCRRTGMGGQETHVIFAPLGDLDACWAAYYNLGNHHLQVARAS